MNEYTLHLSQAQIEALENDTFDPAAALEWDLDADGDYELAEFIRLTREGEPVPVYVLAALDERGYDLNALEASITL